MAEDTLTSVENRRTARRRNLVFAGAMAVILSAILYPVAKVAYSRAVASLDSAREDTLRGACQSNLKQLHLAAAMYCQDYDHRFPLRESWISGLTPYVKTTQLFICPSDQAGVPTGYSIPTGVFGGTLNHGDKWVHRALLYDAAPYTFFAPRHRGPSGKWGGNVCFTDGRVMWLEIAPAGVPAGPTLPTDDAGSSP
ncbi:MAG TPA: hypothetical protein QGH10_23305 [Armatimonadota bacterium]|nr:hypothetical protein [Armatimonadota bacterium]